MPYILAERKLLLPDKFFDRLGDEPVAGDINYLATRIAHEYVEIKGLRYAFLNDVVGALTGATAEFQRRVVGPYEDLAIAKNEDVMSDFIRRGLATGR